MRTLLPCVTALCLSCWLLGCKGPEKAEHEEWSAGAGKVSAVVQPVAPEPAAAGEVVLEAESLKLTDCTVKDIARAGGGKAVMLQKEGSKAEGSVTLKKGKYEVVVYAQGTSPEEDAVFVTVAGGERWRVYGGDHGSIVPATVVDLEAESFAVTVDKDGPCAVVFTFAEPQVYVDRIVFKLKD